MQEYDNDRWRIISGKVGNGFSAGACREKAIELEGEDMSAGVSTGRYGTSTGIPQETEEEEEDFE
jgi:hypothetical protein